MQIQDDSPHLLDENPPALLAGAQIDAAALYRCLKIVRLWSQTSAPPQSRKDEMIEEGQRLVNLCAAILFEIGSAFSSSETAGQNSKSALRPFAFSRIGNARPRNRDSCFPFPTT